jgi:hypothetical protein
MKTFQEIKEETIQSNRKLYYRDYDYARACALTRFIEEDLSKRAGFQVSSVRPIMLYNRSLEDMEPSKIFSVGLWFGWMIGDIQYYLQMDENPFMDSYLFLAKQTSSRAGMHTYAHRINDTLYNNVEWGCSEEIINQLVKNLRICISVKPEDLSWYKWEIPPYKLPLATTQNIYNV